MRPIYAKGAEKMKILVVDDDEVIRHILVETLAISGFPDVTVAESGQEALEIVASTKTPFNCLLLDIQMPNMDGISLCHELRSTPGYSRVPIIMVTAMTERRYIDNAFAAGATDYITKPFEILEIRTRLNLAKKLNDERGMVKDGFCAVQALKEEIDQKLGHSLTEPVELHGVKHSIGYLAFENYLLELTRARLFFSNVRAMKIAHIDKIYGRLSSAEFHDLLTKVGGAISDNLLKDNNFLAYRGNGVFVSVGQNESDVQNPETIHHLQQALEALDFGGSDPNQKPLHLVLGEPVSPGLLSRPGSLGFLRKAIDDVSARCLNFETKKHNLPNISQRLRENRKRDYEGILRDAIKDGIAPLGIPLGKRHTQPSHG
ncbi:MAG: response regulator [Alphaproteobacteria bacterium]|nr:response regulator [Alphaproteobacteria bacterium]